MPFHGISQIECNICSGIAVFACLAILGAKRSKRRKVAITLVARARMLGSHNMKKSSDRAKNPGQMDAQTLRNASKALSKWGDRGRR
jgi:hypothetical protein